MRPLSILAKQNGSILLPVLAIGSVMGLLGVALMRMTDESVDIQKIIRQQQVIATAHYQTLGLLRNRAICEANFKGIPVTVAPTITNRILSEGGAAPKAYFTKDDVLENKVAKIDDIRISDFKNYGITPPDNLRGVMDVQVSFGSVEGSGLVRARHITLAVEMNSYPPIEPGAPNGLKTCVAIGADDDIWDLNSAGDVFYNGTLPGARVGIGTSNPAANVKLQVATTLLAGDFFHPSDLRLKKDVRPVSGLNAIEKLNGVRFDWRDGSGSAYGVIAQNVESVFPEAVTSAAAGSTKYVDYHQLIAPLVESIKELSAKNQKLRVRIERLQEAARE